MAGKPDLNESNLLIDFSSSPVPVKRNVLRSPLIPIPAFGTNHMSISPTNNPFDVVAKQSVLSVDPFDIVLKNAQKTAKTVDGSLKMSNSQINNQVTSEFHGNDDFVVESQTKTEEGVESSCTKTNERKDETEQRYSANESVTVAEADSQSLAFGDISSEEDLKAVIAKRISKVVTKALNDSRPGSPTNMKENMPKITLMNRRSLSFVTESKKNEKVEKLNKSFSFAQCPKLHTDTEVIKSPDSSFWLLNNSNQFNEASPMSDSVFVPDDNNELVFEEAKKLARTFSRIADSFCHDAGSDNEEDLLTCRPRWLYADSSEDEEEKLRNDPALNVRVCLTPVLQSRRSEPAAKSSKKLSAFLKKARRSLELIHNRSSQEDLRIKSAESDGAKKPGTSESVIPPVVPSVPVVSAVNPPIPEAIKLKKRTAVESKRGPMRAVMPVQSMTREADVKVKPRQFSRDASPPRKQNTMLSLDTPKTSSQTLGIRPVASSTPNRPVDHLMPSPLAVVASNTKRRSLGNSTVERHKSRVAEAEGARQRSNSASSKIPALNQSAGGKSLLGTSVKSASNLPSRNIPTLQVSTQQSKLKSSSFSSKPLNDVKAKSSPKSGIRSTVSAGLSNIAGKFTGRKTTVQNKENKVPT